MSYKKLFITLSISAVLMYLMMFLNMNSINDYYTSLTRIYMALMMVSPMAILMIIMMGKMYPNKKYNSIIIVVSALIFVLTLTGLRMQIPINDEQYLKAMIPHHSSAIMTSRNADIKDPEVRKLADSIIKSQQREIDEMNRMIKRLR
ncbi:DUF305 domain-containing protein [Chryseobacterium taichungense]|uniref:DUF305 domain-containing protein n=1 Tax=Chryseobacterium taichungense TaxID=295069 RepID=A0A1H7XF25_9FLAO|nr:DUF305 domain-containing protein [Chryseobacterium taichungense]SEM32214.1 protein of unknown function [Chryseobacterium taichungense]